jgi:hypothetical protein
MKSMRPRKEALSGRICRVQFCPPSEVWKMLAVQSSSSPSQS